MDVPMSNEDIKSFLGKKVATLSYNQLGEIDNLDKALNAVPFLFVLYEYKPNYGHWTCILRSINKQGAPCIEFFDSYGSKPDSQLGGFSPEIRNEYGMSFPLVAKLLLESKYPIEYNNHKLQKHNSKIQTCGRWGMLRCMFHDMHIDEFAKMFQNKKKYSPDQLVTLAHESLS